MIRPIIAIVGRPNVGKSTLFNRLVGRRQALVRDTPGVTRDRLYGRVAFERWQATAIDTGGFDPSSEEPLIEGVRRQVLTAVEEADLVLFVIDVREGVTALDLEVAAILRKAGRPVVLAANKVASAAQEDTLGDLYRLGFGAPVPVSAEHGRGVAEMIELLRERCPAPRTPTERPATPVHIAVVGRPNVGKSSLVNAMVGAERVLVHEAPGTTRDSVDTPLAHQKGRGRRSDPRAAAVPRLRTRVLHVGHGVPGDSGALRHDRPGGGGGSAAYPEPCGPGSDAHGDRPTPRVRARRLPDDP